MSNNKKQEAKIANRLKEKKAREEAQEEDTVVLDQVETNSEVIPVQDILALIESKVADQVGEIELEREQVDDSDRLTADDLEVVIAQKLEEKQGVDEEAVAEKINLLEDKLKSEAQEEFKKVQTAVGTLANEGRAKFSEVENQVDTKLSQAVSTGLSKIAEVETQVDAKLSQAVNAGLSKIAEAEKAMTERAAAEVGKAKRDGKAYLNHQMEQFKKEIIAIVDEKITTALAKKD